MVKVVVLIILDFIFCYCFWKILDVLLMGLISSLVVGHNEIMQSLPTKQNRIALGWKSAKAI